MGLCKENFANFRQYLKIFNGCGDQPKAIKQIYNNLKSDTKNQTLLGVTGSGKTFTMAKVIEKYQKPTLVISHSELPCVSEYRQHRASQLIKFK